MRYLFLIGLLGAIGQCYAGTFNLDTIDNWQIYNRTELVFGGHAPSYTTEFQGTIKTTNLKTLEIQYNHCVRYSDINVIIEITDENGQILLTKKFKINSGTRMIIERKELGRLIPKSITIRYVEKKKKWS